MRRFPLLAVTAVLTACGSEVTAPSISRVDIDPSATMVVGVGESVDFRVVAFDVSGRSTSTGDATWRSGDAGVAAVTSSGVATAVGAGTTTIIVELGGMADTATFEVWVPSTVSAYQPGTSYFDRNEYVEYIPGTLPVVLSAPHGGALTPDEIPDRTFGTLVQANPLPFSALLRGGTSFGAYLSGQAIRAVPSVTDPSPGSDSYFSGGYNTVRPALGLGGGAVHARALRVLRAGRVGRSAFSESSVPTP